MKKIKLLSVLLVVFSSFHQMGFSAEKTPLGIPIKELNQIKAKVYADRATNPTLTHYSAKLNKGNPPQTSYESYWNSQTYEVLSLPRDGEWSVTFTRFDGDFLMSTLMFLFPSKKCLDRFVEEVLENPEAKIHYKFEFLKRVSYNRFSVAKGAITQDIYLGSPFFYKAPKMPTIDKLLEEEPYRGGHLPDGYIYLGTYVIRQSDLWLVIPKDDENTDARNLKTFCSEQL